MDNVSLAVRVASRYKASAGSPEAALATVLTTALKAAGVKEDLKSAAQYAARQATSSWRQQVEELTHLMGKKTQTSGLKVLHKAHKDSSYEDEAGSVFLEVEFADKVQLALRGSLNPDKMIEEIEKELFDEVPETSYAEARKALASDECAKGMRKAFEAVLAGVDFGTYAPAESVILDYVNDRAHRSVDSDEDEAEVAYGKHAFSVKSVVGKVNPLPMEFTFEAVFTYSIGVDFFWPTHSKYDDYM